MSDLPTACPNFAPVQPCKADDLLASTLPALVQPQLPPPLLLHCTALPALLDPALPALPFPPRTSHPFALPCLCRYACRAPAGLGTTASAAKHPVSLRCLQGARRFGNYSFDRIQPIVERLEQLGQAHGGKTPAQARKQRAAQSLATLAHWPACMRMNEWPAQWAPGRACS